LRLAAFALLPLLALATSALADPVDDIVTEQMQVSHLPGVAVAIVDRGQVTKMAAYGTANLEWNGPVDPHTRFQLASATKLFTGLLLMRAVKQGKLSLDAPVANFFPGAPDSWKRIKVRQLANHTSGLSESLGQPRPRTVAEAVAASMKQPLAYEPGTEARYGFTDFTILRAILEKVGGASLPELLDRELVRPLGLKDTGFALAEEEDGVRTGEVLPGRASTYGWNGQRQRMSDFFFEPLGYGAGGLYSSAADLATLFAALDTAASLKELTTPATLPGGRRSGFGIGWTARDYHGVPVVGHSGGPALADILRIPSQGRTIIVLTNQHNFFPMLAERIADLTIPPLPAPTVKDDRPAIGHNLDSLFRAVAAGAPTAAFTAPGSDPAAPLASGFGKAAVDAVGPLKGSAFVGPEPGGKRRYRLTFARKQWDWLVQADEQGRISDMEPAS